MKVKAKQTQTKAQKWAKLRNFSKFRLLGILGSLIAIEKLGILTPSEQMHLTQSSDEIRHIVKSWDRRNEISKKKYLGK